MYSVDTGSVMVVVLVERPCVFGEIKKDFEGTGRALS